MGQMNSGQENGRVMTPTVERPAIPQVVQDEASTVAVTMYAYP